MTAADGIGTGTVMTVLIWVISIFLVWYSKQQVKAGVLT